jgi:hypothetical protein
MSHDRNARHNLAWKQGPYRSLTQSECARAFRFNISIKSKATIGAIQVRVVMSTGLSSADIETAPPGTISVYVRIAIGHICMS